jgi:ribonucleoside-diphosphate reductase alpha chain
MNNYLPTDYQAFIHTSRYAKYFDGKGREAWPETVDRYIENVIGDKVDSDTKDEIMFAILNLEIMPSMRAMMTAGIALDRDNTAGYNCSYLPVDDPKSFDEAMFILLCGTGVGFSVERQFISKLPEIPKLFDSDTTIVVKDSKEGWAKAFRQLLVLLWAGEVPLWDVSRVRPAGARLKTFGGRASGPAPLVDLFNFSVKMFREAEGRKLSSIECHDLMCKIGEIVVVGGVRRSAMISLSNLSDDRMRHAKSGNWWDNEPQRALANNSVAYTEKPDSLSFMREWMALVESGSGERGIFNREASKKQAAKNGRRDPNFEFGTNPCSEIILRPYQFCNLTEVVVRATDTVEDLERKVRFATILGTIQSTYTNFPYLRKIWTTKHRRRKTLRCKLNWYYGQPCNDYKE